MEYAVEYALMSELYDERCVALEGLGILGKIGRVLKSIWEWIVRKVGEIISKIKGGRKSTIQTSSAPSASNRQPGNALPAPRQESTVKLSELNSLTCRLIGRGIGIANTIEKIYTYMSSNQSCKSILDVLREAVENADEANSKVIDMAREAHGTGFAPEARKVDTRSIVEGLTELQGVAAKVSKLVDGGSNSSEFKYSYMKPAEFKYSYMQPDGFGSDNPTDINNAISKASDMVRNIIATVNDVVQLIQRF